MSSKKPGTGDNSPSPRKNSGSFSPIQFINVNLQDAHKQAFAHWLTLSPDVVSLLDDVILGGYKLSVGYDEGSNSYLATITNRKGVPEFVNHCFTLRARDAWTAIARVLWLHAVFAQGDWREFGGIASSGDVW